MSLLVKSGTPLPDGTLEYVGFEARTGDLSGETGARELCAVVLGGACEVRSGAGEWSGMGERDSPFDGLPHAVYLPPGTSFSFEGDAELALCWAPASEGAEARVIAPEDVGVETRGSGSMEREIHNILMEDAAAEALLVTEVVTPAGH